MLKSKLDTTEEYKGENKMKQRRRFFQKIRNWNERLKKDNLKILKIVGKKKLQNLLHILGSSVAKYHEKSNWTNFNVIVVNILVLLSYHSMDRLLARYEGKGALYDLSIYILPVLLVICIWELICCLGIGTFRYLYNNLKKLKGCLCRSKRYSIICIAVCILAGLCFYSAKKNIHSTKYYASLQEVFGVPSGAGKELSRKERQQRSNYWKIKDYKFRNHISIIHIDGYEQADMMSDYSTASNMQLFQNPARIEVDYIQNENKYRVNGRDYDYYHGAGENDFREPQKISYYNSSGKLLLSLNHENGDNFEIDMYSSDDLPQILNATLLKVPQEEEGDEKTWSTKIDMSAQKIETTYNADGLPLTRRICPYVYNLYGINGESYTYDSKKRMTSICYLDVNGAPACNKKGIMMITFRYDDADNLCSIRYFGDKNGEKKIEGFHGVFCEKFEYDIYGNLLCRKQMNRSECWCYDENGVYSYQYEYENGKLIKESYFGLNDSPTKNRNLQCTSMSFSSKKKFGKREISVFFGSDIFDSPDPDIQNMQTEKMKSVMNLAYGNDISAQESQIQGTDILEKTDVQLKMQNVPVSELDERGLQDNEDSVNQGDSINLSDMSRKYVRIRFVLKNGCIIETSYHDRDGNLVENESGYAVQCFSYDNDNRIRKESYLNAKSKPCAGKGGFAGIEKEYDKQSGKLKKVRYLDVDGNRIVNRDVGYAEVHYNFSYADGQRIVKESYWDHEDQSVALPRLGYTAIERQYNDGGFLKRETYFDKDDSIFCREDYGVAEILYDYTDSGDLSLERYRAADGKPVNRLDTGYAVIHQQFENGHLTQKWYEGYKGELLCKVKDKTTGIAGIQYSYINGRIEKVQYLDETDKSVIRYDEGYAEQRFAYTEEGQISKKSFYDSNGNLVIRKEYGYAELEMKYNDLGQHEYTYYYDTKNKPVISTKHHYAGVHYKYDDMGNKSEIQYLAPDSSMEQPKLMIHKEYGFAHIKSMYDSSGNLRRQEYFSNNGERAIYRGYGYAMIEKDFKNGRCVEVRYFGTDEKPVMRTDTGYARITFEYDDQGQEIGQYYFDRNEKSVISKKYHCAGMRFAYDKRGNQTDTWYLGLDGKPMFRNDLGYAHYSREYDSLGNFMSTAYFDADENPAVSKEKGYSYSQWEYEKTEYINRESEYKDNGTCARVRYYNPSGNLILRSDTGYAVVEDIYDEYGQYVAANFYGIDEKPVISTKYHCAAFRYEYDERGNRTDIRYLGVDEKIIVRSDLGYAHLLFDYDDCGNEVETKYFDEKDKPTVSREGGYASIVSKYDDRGQKIEVNYFGIDGKSVISRNNYCAGFKYQYDDFGNRTDAWFLGLDQEHMIRSDLGYAHWESQFDAFGNEISVTTYDAKEKLTLCREGGYAFYERHFDDYGQIAKVCYYGINNKPIISKQNHCAEIQYLYDAFGNLKKTSYHGLDGELMIRQDKGYAYLLSEYDEFGNEKKVVYFDDKKHKTFWMEGGYASFERQYDSYGREKSCFYYNVDKKPIISAIDHCAGDRKSVV